jgi:hypothetical protein
MANPEKAGLIDAALGEANPFDISYRHYAHDVGPETAFLPAGWKGRLIKMQLE